MDRASITEAIRLAFATSLSSGTFVDTSYWAFSSRLRDGIVQSPRVIYANSTVLKAAGEYFAAQLGGGFDTRQSVTRVSTEAYSYEDDSDLEDFDEDGGDHDDWADQSDSGSTRSSPLAKGKGKAEAETTKAVVPSNKAENCSHIKYSIVLPDVAANTWHALIYYIYTGEIHFAPLKSQGRALRTKGCVEYHERNPEKPVLCSPKSMYRLADIVGIDELKRIARDDLSTKLSYDAVVEEVFSRFSSTYPEVLDAQLQYLYRADVMPAVIPQLQAKLKAVTEGRLPHAENVLNALVLKLSALVIDVRELRETNAEVAVHPEIEDTAVGMSAKAFRFRTLDTQNVPPLFPSPSMLDSPASQPSPRAQAGRGRGVRRW